MNKSLHNIRASLRSSLRASWRKHWCLWGLCAFVMIPMLGVLIAALLVYPSLPDTRVLLNYTPRQVLRIYSADGVELAGFGVERRIFQPIDKIPPLLKNSILAVEDSRFYSHPGIDFIGVARAIVANLTGGRRQGASTITQQVARNFFLSHEITLSRKFKEALLALRIEKNLSKDQILELYMNQIFLGARAYGFESAAHTYFGKTLHALSIAEVAMLAGLPQNPSNANPIRNWKSAKQRQLIVLSRMLKQGVITQEEWKIAREESLHIRQPNTTEIHAEYVAEMVREQVVAQFGENAYKLGLNITTTVLADEQQSAWRAVRQALIQHELGQPWRGPEGQVPVPVEWEEEDARLLQAMSEYKDDEDLRLGIVTAVHNNSVHVLMLNGEVLQLGSESLRQARAGLSPQSPSAQRLRRGSVVRLFRQPKHWLITHWPQAQAAFTGLDPHNGKIRALVGGFDFSRSAFNRATQAWRQPGSSFKPFLYSAVLEYGVMPQTLVNDDVLNHVGNWSPKNQDHSTDGLMTVRQALAQSKNLVSIRLLQLIGVARARQWAEQFGFDAGKLPQDLTLALGTGNTNALQMASAYAVFANQGHTLKPQLIERITDSQGNIMFEAALQQPNDNNRVISERNAFLTSTMLQEVMISGTGARAHSALKRNDLYGKTGTTDDVMDAWFAGYHPSRVAVMWMGHDSPRSLGRGSGASLSLPAWIEYMRTALKNVPEQDMNTPPAGVTQIGGEWRYTEWAAGGFITVLGLDDEPISPALIPELYELNTP